MENMRSMRSASRFQRWRAANGLRLAEVADLVGLSVTTISRLERGERRLKPKTKVIVARRLGVPVRALFSVVDR